MGTIELVQGDITTLPLDIIVNAANRSLCGGGGVDGAIHRAAGPDLLAHCRRLGSVATGSVTATPGFQLPAKTILHAVGPVWSGGDNGEPALLAKCYRTSLELAAAEKAQSIAFPCISTGAYRFPADKAVEIAVHEVRAWLETHDSPARVVLCVFTPQDYRLYLMALGADSILVRSLQKDPNILNVIKKLKCEERGWAFVDYWDADLTAIGIIAPRAPRKIAYISTWQQEKPGWYFLELESPDGPALVDYKVDGTFESIDFAELERRVVAHLTSM